MSNLYLSVLHSLGIQQESFADSTGTLSDSIFSAPKTHGCAFVARPR